MVRLSSVYIVVFVERRDPEGEEVVRNEEKEENDGGEEEREINAPGRSVVLSVLGGPLKCGVKAPPHRPLHPSRCLLRPLSSTNRRREAREV
jgi:hypothetical protein